MEEYKDFYHSKQIVNDLRVFEEGRIVAVNEESRTYTVQTTHYTTSEVPYVKDSGVLKSSGDELLKIYDRVLLYQSESKPMILFVMPEGNSDNTSHPPISYTNVTPVTEAPENLSDVSYRTGGAFDAMPGEFIKYGPEGGIISILRGGVVKLGAGSLSQLQFHTIDDLTRLISRNVDVFTDFGEKRIYNDEGEVNLEVYGATQQFETMGSDKPDEEIGEHSPKEGFPRYRAEPYDRMGKWKIHGFAGWLGDNLHLFISRRGETNQRLKKEAPVGLAEVIISHDGAVRVRSAREVVLEKVSRIRVPKKIREPHHNEKGDTKVEKEDREGKGYKPSLHKFYQWDQTNKAGRYLQYPEWHNHYVDHEEVRRFRDHNKDWFVESETKAKMARKAKDLYEGSDEEKFEETSATFRIGNDGSIYAEDTWGSILSMCNEDIILSARRDIKIQAGRDLQISGTREGTLRTQKDLDIVSHKGTIRAKGHQDLLLAADNGNASLDSGKGNTSLISRQKDVLIRAERADVITKADLGNIREVAVSGEINSRANGDISIASDSSQVKIHGSSKAQVTSGAEILVAVGDESPELNMEAKQRDIDRFTNTTESIDKGNTVSVTNLRDHSFLYLGSLDAKLYSVADTQVSSIQRSRVFTDSTKLRIEPSGYILSSENNGTIVRNQNQEITLRDDDTDSNGRNRTWNTGASHSNESLPEESAVDLTMTEADIQKEEFAQGRFRYKESSNRGDLIKNYNFPWNNEGEKVNLTKDLVEWQSIIPNDTQEIPDVGHTRPVTGDSQEATEEENIEQVAPYSNYLKYNDGTYSYTEKKVKPGSFEEVTDIKVPTVWENQPASKGRLNSFPKEAEGESFEGTLERSDFEDVVNSQVNFTDGQ
jgi:hypothetical protein